MTLRTNSSELRRVYLISWWFADFGGMERHITELAKSLQHQGIEVTVVSEMPTRRRNQYRTELRKEGIRFISPQVPLGLVMWWQRRFPLPAGAGQPAGDDAVSLAMGKSLMAKLLKLVLSRRLQRETPDVVHVHGWRLSQWAATWYASLGIPAVYTEHSTIADWGGPVHRCAPDWLAGAGDVACVSDAARHSLAAWLAGRPLALHQHIVRLPDSLTRPKPGGVTRLITVARLRAEKGLDILLRAAARLRSQGSPFQLEIVGDGPMLGELTRLRAELGLDACVHLTRGLPAEGIHERLRRADVFVLASRTEALSLALLEAMSHGLAIVATAVGGIPEFIRDGETGLLAPPESVDALADAMGRLLADEALRARLGENARKHLEASTFSEACCLERVLASYDRARNLAAAR